MESELLMLRALGSMEERIRLACHAPGATYNQAVKVCTWLSLQRSWMQGTWYMKMLPVDMHGTSNKLRCTHEVQPYEETKDGSLVTSASPFSSHS